MPPSFGLKSNFKLGLGFGGHVRFASGLLLPKYLISNLTDEELTWANIRYVSKRCQASLEAAYRRMSLEHTNPSAFIIHEHGQFKRFVASENFDFYIEKSPLSSSQKDRVVDVDSEGYPEDFEEDDAMDWVNPKSKYWRICTIYSSSIMLKNGYSYTLLTYDDDCMEDAFQ